jgi:hypothetical protein
LPRPHSFPQDAYLAIHSKGFVFSHWGYSKPSKPKTCFNASFFPRLHLLLQYVYLATSKFPGIGFVFFPWSYHKRIRLKPAF